MLTDRYGLMLSTSSQVARDAYVEGSDSVLSAGAGAERHFGYALEADPEFALARIGLARAMFLGGKSLPAREEAACARELATRTTPREQSHVNALALGVEGKAEQSLAAIRGHVAVYARDAMVLAPASTVLGLIGLSGDPRREEEQLLLLRSLAPNYGDDWWFNGVLAFAAGECGRLDEAWDLIERSLAGNPRNAYGAHIRVHVLYEKGEPEPAFRYLDAWMPGFAREGLMHCHLSWHVALLALELGQVERAWEVYRAQVLPGGAWGPPLNMATDAPAFLWRAELAGQERRRELWRGVHDYTVKAFPNGRVAFADVHRAVAFAATDDRNGLEQLIRDLRKCVAENSLPAGSVVPTLAEAFGAFARHDWDGAIALFESALPETVRIGGSRAQRDLVELTLVAAYLRAGRTADSHRLIARRSKRKATVNVAGFEPPGPSSKEQ